MNETVKEVGMFLEFDWTGCVYRPRFGRTFTEVGGCRFFVSLAEARDVLASCRLKLGPKTDTRTWKIEAAS